MCVVKVGGAMSCWGNLELSEVDPNYADGGAPEQTYFDAGVREVYVGSPGMSS